MKLLLAALLACLTPTLAVRSLQFASPLQAFTIWDEDVANGTTARDRFLPQYRAGLNAETKARQSLSSQLTASASKNWDQDAAKQESQLQSQHDQALEAAFDGAANAVKKAQALAQANNAASKSKYQFVGVIGRPSEPEAIQWYARHKPSSSKWTVRLVHVNRQAIVKDLFDSGKIDIFGKYVNTQTKNTETGLPVIESHYSVRERSWK